MNQAAIEFGSNINPEENIRAAKKMISERYKIIAESKPLVTKPVGFKNQPDFINCAVLIETEKNYEELKQDLNGIEINVGRIKDSNKFGPRIIDLDIIVWNQNIIHNDYYEREYVKINLNEVLPELSKKIN